MEEKLKKSQWELHLEEHFPQEDEKVKENKTAKKETQNEEQLYWEQSADGGEAEPDADSGR